MKFVLLPLLLLILSPTLLGQIESSLEAVEIILKEEKPQVSINENGGLVIRVFSKDVAKFKTLGTVTYGDFGAIGDGKADDIDAIAAAHAYANREGLSVKADAGATYYIGGKERTVEIRTDTDFGTSTFIIDDTEVENNRAAVFRVSSGQKAFQLAGISSLKRNQEKIDVALPGACLITAANSQVKHYIRFGLNQNNGSDQTDIFVADKDGRV
ncbi:MAG: hypothetical protein AAGA62_03395, partial [Bacteroidota bacterium]